MVQVDNSFGQLDQLFVDYHHIVEHRIKTRGERAVKIQSAQPGVVQSGHAAGKSVILLYLDHSAYCIDVKALAAEFVHELAEYLSRKYPNIYQVTRKPKSEKSHTGWYGEGEISKITAMPLQKTYDLDTEDPMKLASWLFVSQLV